MRACNFYWLDDYQIVFIFLLHTYKNWQNCFFFYYAIMNAFIGSMVVFTLCKGVPDNVIKIIIKAQHNSVELKVDFFFFPSIGIYI